MFNRIVAVDNTKINKEGQQKLRTLAHVVELYEDNPTSPQECINRIGDADCVLVSHETPLRRDVIEACPNIKYIGMCCSLYDESSANVDIAACRERGIVVKGIYDYGDEGVIEFIIASLVWLMHGFGKHSWRGYPTELTGHKVGIIGMGTVGTMLAHALKTFKADIYYYSRTRKPELEQQEGFTYLPLDELLTTVDILSIHVPRNSKILTGREFALFGNGKILINTGLGPMFPVPDLKLWLEHESNFYICDKPGMGAYRAELKPLHNVLSVDIGAGASDQCIERLSRKVVDNINAYFAEQ